LREFSGTVRKGKVELDDKVGWNALLGRLDGKRVNVSLETHEQRRSSQANRWYWSCVVPLAAEALSVGRTVPLSKDQAHYVLKSAFLGVEETPLGTVPKSTSKLTKPEFWSYCERIVAHCASEWGMAVPMPGERYEASL